MRIFLDFNHPAHVHLFKNFIMEFQKMGHKFLLSSRDKECSYSLLDAYGLDYIKRRGYRGIKKVSGLFAINYFLHHIAKDFKPDILIGGVGNAYIAHTAVLLGKPSFIFDDTEYSKLQNLMTFPFAKNIITPSCFTINLGKKQIRHNSYHELAYLHPHRFRPDPGIIKKAGISCPYALVRFVDWQASHDILGHGIKNKTGLIRKLSERVNVLISSEKKLPMELEGYRIKLHASKLHDLIAGSSLYIGESATMASESAVLGIPSILVSNSTRGYIRDLSGYGLVHRFKREKHALNKAFEILADNDSAVIYQEKRKKMLSDKICLTDWMLGFFSALKA